MTPDALLREYALRRDQKEAAEERRKEIGAEIRTRIGAGKELAGERLRGRIVAPPEYFLDPHAAGQAVADVLVARGILAQEARQEKIDEVVAAVAPREVSARRLGEYLAKYPAEVRAEARKAVEEAKIAVDAGSHVRVEEYKNPFAVGQEES